MNHCLRHYEEPVAATCRTCRNPYCNRCLVYSFGPKKPPYCVGCALVASGIRNGGPVRSAVAGAEEAPVVPGAPANKPAAAAAAAARADTAPAQDKRADRAYKRAEKTAQKQHARAMKKAIKTDGATTAALLAADPPPPAAVGRVPAPSTLLAGHEAG